MPKSPPKSSPKTASKSASRSAVPRTRPKLAKVPAKVPIKVPINLAKQNTHTKVLPFKAVGQPWWHSVSLWLAALRRPLQQRLAPAPDPLSAVKAGVLAEMQTIARTKGGVSGSPFATVLLPQAALANPRKIRVGFLPIRQAGWAALGVVLMGLLLWPILVRDFTAVQQLRQAAPLPVADVADVEEARVHTPQVDAAPRVTQAAAPQAALWLGQAALAEVVRTVALHSRPNHQRADQMVLTATVANAGAKPLRQLKLQLQVDDQAGVPLLRRILMVEKVPAQGAHTQRFVLDLLPTQPERLVPTVSLAALRASLVPLQAEVVN